MNRGTAMSSENKTSDFGRAFNITFGVLIAVVVVLFVLPVGCTACLAVLSTGYP